MSSRSSSYQMFSASDYVPASTQFCQYSLVVTVGSLLVYEQFETEILPNCFCGIDNNNRSLVFDELVIV